ncbi:unnamed protein product [Camellia sinensis]
MMMMARSADAAVVLRNGVCDHLHKVFQLQSQESIPLQQSVAYAFVCFALLLCSFSLGGV